MLKVLGSDVHALDEGSGQPLLLLHGNPESSDMWRPIAAHLRDRFHCVAPDLPGFGRSGVPDGYDCSLEAMSRWVDGVVDAAGISTPLTLVVHDFGGPYGLAWAIEHPDRVARVVVINSLFHASYRWHTWGRIWRTPILGELSQIFMNRPLFVAAMRRDSDRIPLEYLHAVYDQITPKMKRMVLQLYRATDPAKFGPWEDRMRALTARVPTQVLWGERDPYLPRAFADQFGAREVRRFDDCGHFLPVEAPERVAEAIAEFVVASS